LCYVSRIRSALLSEQGSFFSPSGSEGRKKKSGSANYITECFIYDFNHIQQMPTISSFDNTEIFYSFHSGLKGTIIFVHGWPHNHTVWDREIKHFSRKGYCTIALDLRGHGMSGKPTKQSAYKIENFAKDIKQIIVKNKVKNPILVGHSFGGMVLLKFEELFPGLAKCLILIDTTSENPLKDLPILKYFNLTSLTKHLLKHILKHKHIQNKHFKEIEFSKMKNHSDLFYWIKGAENTPINSLLMCLKDMLEFDESKILKKISIPCLLIEGEKDFKTPRDVALNMHKKLKNSKISFIKNAAHDTNIRNAEEVNKIIEKFLVDL